jgi:glycosyltransferase involved in cell wall biosynthesis
MHKFSVVIPVFNKERYIKETIASVLNQVDATFEIVLVNDGSTDGSAAIIEEFGTKNIRLISQTNKGVSAARNTGIAAAKYPYIAFLDADDLWDPSYLSTISKLISTYDRQRVFATQCVVETKKQSAAPIYSISDLRPNESRVLQFFESSLISSILTSSSVVINKEALDEIGQFNINLKSTEDTEYWIRLGLKHTIAFKNTPLATYRFDEKSLSNKKIDFDNVLNLDLYESEIKHHQGLKKFLDINRFSLAVSANLAGQKKVFAMYKAGIDVTNLNNKQRYLLASPRYQLVVLNYAKKIMAVLGISTSAYK